VDRQANEILRDKSSGVDNCLQKEGFMLKIDERHKEYFDAVVAFAKQRKLYEPEARAVDGAQYLQDKLVYLGGYAGVENTECELYPDSPHSFGFSLYLVRNRNTGERLPERRFWFSGGLLYHGPEDGFGSGAGPTHAVTLNATLGWSVHT
jgi:hypothetical protein